MLPLTDFPERIHELDRVELVLPDSRILVTIESVAMSGRYWLLNLVGVDDREKALGFKGGFLVVRKEDRVALPEGSYYHDQLLGLKVLTPGGDKLGQIVNIIATGGHDQFVMKRDDTGKTALIPAARVIVISVDLKAGIIVIDPPEGLLEL